MNIWALVDHQTGHNNQTLGVCEALRDLFGYDFSTKQVRHTWVAKLPNFFLGAGGLSFAHSILENVEPPDIIVTTGRRNAPVSRHIKRRSEGRTKIVQIMDPECGYEEFDLLVVPWHDKFSRDGTNAKGKNVLRTVGAPNRLRDVKLAEEAEKWRGRLPDLPRPWIALLVGADEGAKFPLLTSVDELADGVSEMARETRGSVFFLNSPRTGDRMTAMFEERLPSERFQYIWGMGGENPYLAMMALADSIVVTGDSMSMCSEAAGSRAKEVYVYAPKRMRSPKYQRLFDSLYAGGNAKPFGTTWLEGEVRSRLSAADEVAAAVARLAGRVSRYAIPQ